MCRMGGRTRPLLLLLGMLAASHAITFPCIPPLLGPTIPSAPSREPSPARSRTPDESDGSSLLPMNRLTIRGGDLQVTRTPRARSESGVDSTEEVSLFDTIGKMRFANSDELGGLVNPSEAEARRAIASGKGKVMRYIADGNWEFVTVLDAAPSEISYRYALVRERGEPLVEGGARSGRLLDVSDIVKKGFGLVSDEEAAGLGPLQVEIRDQWRVSRANGEDVLFKSEAFKVMYGKGRGLQAQAGKVSSPLVLKPPPAPPPAAVVVVAGAAAAAAAAAAAPAARDVAAAEVKVPSSHFLLNVERMRVPHGKAMAVESQELFGSKPVVMSSALLPVWELNVVVPQSMLPVSYRYVVVDEATNQVVDREAGAARWLGPALGNAQLAQGQDPNSEGHYVVMVRDEASTDRWPLDAMVRAKAAGLSVSLNSLRGSDGACAGDVMDIKGLVDMCVASGLQALHVESLGDVEGMTDWSESDEAEPVFAHAIHPVYTSLDALASSLGDSAADVIKVGLKGIKAGASLKDIAAAKCLLLRKVFNTTGKAVVESDGFATFVQDNGHWLKPYALFFALSEEHGTTDATKWGDHARLTPSQIDSMSSPGGPKYVACRYWYWLQYNVHNQLLQASQYARDMGVALVGDMPYALSRGSVDFWARPEQFRADKVVGTPPSAASPAGRSWGKAAYDWDRMNREGGAWWLGRMRRFATYFHGVQLGHALGFFRHWELPASAVTGLGGRQNPCNCITREELDVSGLWDRRRLCEPYVRKHVLQRRLGAAWELVAGRFLDETGEGAYKFKSGLDTEKALADAVKAQPLGVAGLAEDDALRELFLLLNDRCLIRDDKSPDDKFYPRAMMWLTDSYAELGQDWQRRLRDLHDAHFSWKQEELFENTARERFRVLQTSSSMLLCAEEIGPVPNCFPKVLSELGILASRLPASQPTSYLSAACTAAAGSSIEVWWKGLSQEAKQQCWKDLGCAGEASKEVTSALVSAVFKKLLASESVLAFLPFKDVLSLAAKAKNGTKAVSLATLDKSGRLSSRDLATSFALNAVIASLVKDSGRSL